MPFTSMSFTPIMNTIAESTAFGRKLRGRVRKRSTINTTAAVVRWATWLRPPASSTISVLVGLPLTTKVPLTAAAAFAAAR
jgi:hypothetical protein